MKEFTNWQHEWVCKCGKQFYFMRPVKSSRFMPPIVDCRHYSALRSVTFGPDDLCPSCGGTLGKMGPLDQVYHRVGRFQTIEHKKETYRWWNPWTWPKYRIRYKHEVKGENNHEN